MLLSLPHPSLYYPAKSPKPVTKSPKPIKPFPLLLTGSSLSTKPKSTSASTSAIQRISDKLRSLGYLESNPNPNFQPAPGPGTAGEIFIPTPLELPKHRVGHTIDSSWSTPESPVPEPGSGLTRFRELWRKGKEDRRRRMKEEKKEKMPMLAELLIAREELKRLRSIGIRLVKTLKVGKAGITEGIVNGIHERWRRSELVKIKCKDLCWLNMKRTHEILERKTGGLVIWRSGSIIILYRGADYKYPYFSNGGQLNSNPENTSEDPNMIDAASTEQRENILSTSAIVPFTKSSNNLSHSSFVIGVGSPNKVRLRLPGEVQFEEEADRLLDGLGPRFTDWWGYEPLPVDADLLPAIVPGYRKPFRLLPFGVKPKLTDREMTILRRLSRPLPCHFALGRNRNHQGLAVSMIKLWEKCEVAKIAVKRGVQNTSTVIMTEELKKLTGGVLLSKDREFFVFYRGKDFLPSAVSTAIEERRNSEVSRLKQSSHDSSTHETAALPMRARLASLDEHQDATTESKSVAIKSRLKPASSVIERVEVKLSQALQKKEKALRLLATLEESTEAPVVESDRETITEEERYMLRKVGLRMEPYLPLGRRGVFAGTVENMHLHWKYRELVKLISKDWSIQHVESAARTLEAESGGILVAVERVNKGHAIIIYRGKNYCRPKNLRPKTLLNKKAAMKYSLEAQRFASLKLHVLSLSRTVDHLQHQMAKEHSAADKMQLIESDKSDVKDKMNGQSWSIEGDNGSVKMNGQSWSIEGDNQSVRKNERSWSIERDNGAVESSYHHVNTESLQTKEHVAVDSMQLIENDKSEVKDEMNDQSWSIARDNGPAGSSYHQESAEEVNGIVAVDLHSNKHDCVPNNGEESTFTSSNDNWVAPKLVDDCSMSEDVQLATESPNMADNISGYISDEPEFLPESRQHQEQVPVSSTRNLSHFSDEEKAGLSFGAAGSRMNAHVYEDNLEHDSDLENSFRAAPLSNRERLLLRQQALKMRKRPVLAVGRSNIVTGVAKTIKTHFKKHPLAIVNIKGRAEGTSVQQVIFELEQATGAVLVSREPNKVILYRGWGEGEVPGGSPKTKDVGKGWASVREEICPKLIDAIRVECGISTDKME